MADWHHLAAALRIRKLPYLGDSSTDCHEICHTDAYWPCEPNRTLKFWTFTVKTADSHKATILKTVKLLHLSNGSIDPHEIWHGGAYWP